MYAIVIGILFLVVMCIALSVLEEKDERMHKPHPDLIVKPDASEVGEGHVRHP